MRRALRNVAVLAGLAAAAGAGVAWFAAFTEDAIAANRQRAEARLLRELTGLDAAPRDGEVMLCAGDLAVLRARGAGYGGELQLAVALRAAARRGAVVGVRVVEHAETPGFADILAADSAWLASFRGGRGDDVDAATGATVTSRAVIDAVRRAAARFDAAGSCP